MGALGLPALLAGKRAAYTPRSTSSSCGVFSVFLRPGKGVIAEGKGEGLESWSRFQGSFLSPGQVLWLVHYAP